MEPPPSHGANHRGRRTRNNNKAARPSLQQQEGEGTQLTHGGGGNPSITTEKTPRSDTGSGNKRWRKQQRRYTDPKAECDGGVATETEGQQPPLPPAATTSNEEECLRPVAKGSPKTAQAQPPKKKDATVSINSSVRCVDMQGNLYMKSLKELLKMGGNALTEADTPCLGPMDGQVSVVAASQQSLVSPMLAFSLDSIATPNTFATFHTQKPTKARKVKSAQPQASCSAPEDSAVTEAVVISEGDGVAHKQTACRSDDEDDDEEECGMEDLMPPMCAESPYQFILRNFKVAEGTFDYYNTAEGRGLFLEKCFILCQQATAILSNEPLMAYIHAPVYVFGDIHGNFNDLSYFLRSVLAFGDIHLSPCNLLCLGDYVDRGPFSLECVMILLALKVESPHKVTLLRGNHEDRVVCGDRRTYGSDCFAAQCQAIFGPVDGKKLFDTVTAVFRHLPLAAEIVVSNAPNRRRGGESPMCGPEGSSATKGSTGGSFACPPSPHLSLVGSTASQWKRATDQRRQSHEERILCTHGGIPRFNEPPRDKDMLAFLRSEKFPRLLTLFPNNPLVKNDPAAQLDTTAFSEEDLQKAWFVMFDLMWSDPTADDHSPNINEWGFGFNTRGNNVVSFSAKAVETFLDAFHYTMLFRAHQEKAHGIRLSKSQKVLTVFSSSNYLGHGNGAGCVIVTAQGEVQLVVKTSQ